ncbi:hypothetical protein HL657_00985 [Methanoculleus sp. YWC-01]|jgi:hypothetical protein|uniref:Uncharacterized protein n=1 Tax=Methanoculleus nereidis TaxID=2735141 RepID=A0ABU3YZI2_9EURY|nr:hypothetical protein [Methanoculleus sp. YWC-01]MCK9297617.1 hypothetical protein [Methanoculleus sp.]MDV4341770.1 hypothetical protein [Methanoculleus sp. YWC-01]PKL56416.1 MAG: hypothetical protein CVV35_04915 [Methanomicrobiales archaeon HGW-Methanomicrobiales-6]
MPSVRINDGDLPSGTGVEGRRKERRDETPAPARREPEPEVKKAEENPEKPRRGQPLFGDADDADIFYTKTK